MLKRWIIRTRALATEGNPLEDKLIVISGKRIESILPASAARRFSGKAFISGQRYLVFPGLVDIHCHGGGGVDVHSLGGLLATSYFHASHGTSALLLTIFFEGLKELTRMAELIREARPLAPLRLLGLHLEGPYINPEIRGAIPHETLRNIRTPDVRKLVDAACGELKMVTIAPEVPGAEGAIKAFREAGVVVAMGHSLATTNEARAGVDWGANSVTHLGNAMRPFHQRDPGLVGTALTEQRLMAEIVADGNHLAPETLNMFFRAKVGDLILVSDCRWVGGMPEGEHQQGTREKLLVQNGVARRPDGTLAGAIHPLWKGVTTMAALPEVSIFAAVRMATRNPAKLLGKKNLGRISVGGRMDLILAGPDYSLRRVFVGGEEVFRAANEPPLPV
ncbi:amidohydrolase family protein [bacterium]|nr:amidohydrolase family protein [bacterium]